MLHIRRMSHQLVHQFHGLQQRLAEAHARVDEKEIDLREVKSRAKMSDWELIDLTELSKKKTNGCSMATELEVLRLQVGCRMG